MKNQMSAIILAAGKGTRMKSGQAKVLHEVFFRPMLHHVIRAVVPAQPNKICVIIGHQREKVASSISKYPCEVVIQEEQNGTGHAVLCAEESCLEADDVLILCGDTPLLKAETIQAMIDAHYTGNNTITLMTTDMDDPSGYGRIIKDDGGNILKITEEKDATEEEKKIREINGGIYMVDREFLFSALKGVKSDNVQGEFYLTDIIAIGKAQKKKIQPFNHPDSMEILGVNSRVDLAQAHAELQARYNRKVMDSGVSMQNPSSILVSPDSIIGKDSVLEHGVQVTGSSKIGENCLIKSGVSIYNCQIGDNVKVGANSVCDNCKIEAGQQVPPLSKLGAEA